MGQARMDSLYDWLVKAGSLWTVELGFSIMLLARKGIQTNTIPVVPWPRHILPVDWLACHDTNLKLPYQADTDMHADGSR